MKKILILTLFFFSVCHAQIVKDISVYRGDSTRIEFKANGNITAKGITFVVKLTKSFSSPRLIQKKNTIAGGSAAEIITSYSGPQTKVTVILTPEDTRDLSAATYYYDIVAADAGALESYYTFNYGKFTFTNGGDVQTPFDGINTPGNGIRFTTIALDNATSLYSTIVWDTTGKYYYPISLNDFKTLLNVSGSSSGNPDSLNDKPASAYLLKTDTTLFATPWDLASLSIPDQLSDLSADATHRLVTDTEKSTWNAKQNAMGSDDNYVTDAEKTVIGNTSGTNTGDNATNSQYSGLAASKLNVSDAQLFIDTLYRSNDTIYFKQKDGTTLFFVDQNLGGAGDTLDVDIDSLNVLLGLAASALQSSSAINPTNITQSTSYRLVTDTEKNTWNAKLGTTDIQLFVDTLYRSNDTIYFKQKDGSTLYFVDQNTGGEGDTLDITIDSLNVLLGLIPTAIQSGNLNSLADLDTQIGITGTPSSSTYWRGDNSWATVASGFDSTYIYHELDSLKNVIASILVALDTCGCGVDLSDNIPPDPATSYTAIGGTSETQYVATWTDPTTFDLDSLRWYEGSSADTATWTWYASINEGVQTYTRTGRTANTTYWSGVKAIDDSGNVGYFSNIDSATTVPSADVCDGGLLPDSASCFATSGVGYWISLGSSTRAWDADSLYMTVTSTGTDPWGVRSQDNLIDELTTYILTFRAKSSNISARSINLGAGTVNSSTNPNLTTTFQNYTFDWTSGSEQFALTLRIDDQGAVGTQYVIDDIKIIFKTLI